MSALINSAAVNQILSGRTAFPAHFTATNTASSASMWRRPNPSLRAPRASSASNPSMPAGQGAGGAGQSDLAGSSGQGNEADRDQRHGCGQRLGYRRLYRGLQPTLCRAAQRPIWHARADRMNWRASCPSRLPERCRKTCPASSIIGYCKALCSKGETGET